MARSANKGQIYANVSACVWHRKSIQLIMNIFFILSLDVTWVICQSSGSHVQQYPSGDDCLRCPCASLPIAAQGETGKAVRGAWGQIQLTDKAAGWASGQLSIPELTMCLQNPGYVKHPHRTNKYDIRFMSCGTLQGSGKVSPLPQETPGSFPCQMTPCLPIFLFFPVNQIIMAAKCDLCYSLTTLLLHFLFFPNYSHYTHFKSKLWAFYHWKYFI